MEGMRTETNKSNRQLSQLLCEKSDASYSDTNALVKRQISLLWTSIICICIRGSQSKKYKIQAEERMDIDVTNHVVDISQKLC